MEKTGPIYSISITSGAIVRAIFLVALVFFLWAIRDLLLVVLAAVVIASAIEPATKFGRRFHLSRLVSVLAVYAGVASLLAAVFYFFIPVFVTDLGDFFSTLPQYVDSISVWNPLSDSTVAGIGKAKELAQGFSATPSLQAVSETQTGLFANISQISAALSEGGIVQAASIFFGGFLSFVLIAVLSFYLSVQENGIEKFLRVVTPRRNEAYVLDLWRRAQEKIGLWMQGQLVLALLVAILVYLGLTILGVRNALLFAVLAALFETIPLFGPILAAIPAVVVSFVDSGVSGGLITIGLYIIIQQFENHLIYPLVVRKIVGISPILVILALIIGFKMAGFLGVLLAVPVTTIVVEFLSDLERRKAALPA